MSVIYEKNSKRGEIRYLRVVDFCLFSFESNFFFL